MNPPFHQTRAAGDIGEHEKAAAQKLGGELFMVANRTLATGGAAGLLCALEIVRTTKFRYFGRALIRERPIDDLAFFYSDRCA